MRYLLFSVAFLLIQVSLGCALEQGRTFSKLDLYGVGASRFTKSLRSWKDLKTRNIVMQKFDYSCGAAALATLINYYFQDEIDEILILTEIFHTLSKEEQMDRYQNGLSLLDLKNCALRCGYKAVGVKLKVSDLPKLKGPIIIHIDNGEYKHFAILRGVGEDKAYLADPSRGNIRKSMYKFAEEWSGYALVLGKPSFGTPIDYPLALTEAEIGRDEFLSARRAIYR